MTSTSRSRSLALAPVLALLAAGPLPLVAQDAPTITPRSQDVLLVFLDCEPFICDFDHFRREVDFVNYVRNREDADVHVLVTSERTGAGGTDYSFHFIGLGDWAAVGDTLHYVSRPEDTEEETRGGLTQAFALGLVPFVADTPAGPLLEIRYRRPEESGRGAPSLAPEDDPWNLWVFRIRVGGEVNGESRQTETSVDGSLSANRTTEEFKVNLSARGNYQRERYELSDGEELISIRRDFDVEGITVWSLGPHWSAGVQGAVTADTRTNQDLALRFSPALEYNIYPYAESTRRQITFLYKAGLVSFDYEEVTLFDKLSETRLEHSLDVSAEFQQPWGQVTLSVEGSSFLDDFRSHRIDVFSNLEIRLFRGVSLDVRGSVARVKDQIYLPREDISNEDILLARRELGTDFEYRLDVGVSFTFGSPFNNVVNPRMSTGGGGRFRFN